MKSIAELSTELLARYKKKAGEQASAADAAGDFAKGNKRFGGITKATKKQFANAAKPVMKSEEAEHLDELKLSTLIRYSTKAPNKVTVDNQDKRFKGIQRARAKIADMAAARSAAKKTAVAEEAEQIDEISSDARERYADKVVDPVYGMPRSADKLKQRLKGMQRVQKRRQAEWQAKEKTNEQAELDEAEKKLHPDALHISDAGNGKYKVHAVGSNFAHGIKVGEHLSDSELDDAHEMGMKVKMIKKPTNEAADPGKVEIDGHEISARRLFGGRRQADQAAKERIISMSDFKLDSQGRRIKAHRMRFESVEQNDESDNNILVQLKKCVEAADLKGGADVTFANGSTVFVESAAAHRLIESLLGLKPTARLIMQEMVQQSPKHLGAVIANIK